MKMKFLQKIIFSSVLVLIIFTAFSPMLSAQDTGGGGGPGPNPNTGGGTLTITNPINTNSINGFIKSVLVGLIKIGIPLIAIAIIYSGFLFVTAQGKPADIETAKRAFLYTIIGGAILLGAWAIAQLISNTVLAL